MVEGPPAPPPPGPPMDSLPPPDPAARRLPRFDLAAAFRFGWGMFRDSPWPLALPGLAYLALFAVVILVVLAGVVLLPAPGVDDPSAATVVGTVVTVVVAWVGLIAVGQWSLVTLLRAGLTRMDGREVDVRDVASWAYVGRALAVTGLVLVGTLVGMVLLVVPGVVFGIGASYAVHYVVDQDLGPTDAIRASFRLWREHTGPALGLYFVTSWVAGLGIYLCGVGLAVSLPVAYLAQAHGFRQLTGGRLAAAR